MILDTYGKTVRERLYLKVFFQLEIFSFCPLSQLHCCASLSPGELTGKGSVMDSSSTDPSDTEANRLDFPPCFILLI